jgi:hypothetical protein
MEADVSTGLAQARRLAIIETARAMAREAIRATSDPEADPATRRFYHGVETAALHVLRPELAAVRDGSDWLDRRDASFRDGFLEASALLATAASGGPAPFRFLLPGPPAPRRPSA